MKEAGAPPRNRIALTVSLIVIAAAAAVLLFVLRRESEYPSTDDATIDADVVHVAATVGGRVARTGATENGAVRKGDLLFQIDPVPYELAINQAAAALEVSRAANQTQRRAVSTQQSHATIAGSEIAKVQTNYALATRTVERLR